MIAVGTSAPPFEGVDQHGKLVRLESFRETSNVVVFFYPRSFTRGCTREVCEFRDAFDELVNADATVIGISRDAEDVQRRFAAAYKLPFSLLADDGGSIARAFEVRGLLGDLLNVSQRVTFVIDKKGVVRGAFRHELTIERHLVDVRAVLRALA